MITQNLFDTVLVNPATHGADKLFIVSGYAAPAIVYRHLNALAGFSVNLIIGMAKRDGIRLGSHNSFKQIASSDFPRRFSCRYLNTDVPAHAKLYGWFNDAKPYEGFVGSANYSQMAFSINQIEAMGVCDASLIKQTYDDFFPNSVDCLDPKVEDFITFYDERKIITRKTKADGTSEIVEIPAENGTELNRFRDSVIVSLLTTGGVVGDRSGLNWGQRPGRNPNQGYIPLRQEIRAFFPPRGQHFILLTDDGKSLDCVKAQDGGKAIETFRDNSILGAYFRRRMGLPSGKKVTLEDLQRYGRTDAKISKIDDETYFLDFSARRMT